MSSFDETRKTLFPTGAATDTNGLETVFADITLSSNAEHVSSGSSGGHEDASSPSEKDSDYHPEGEPSDDEDSVVDMKTLRERLAELKARSKAEKARRLKAEAEGKAEKAERLKAEKERDELQRVASAAEMRKDKYPAKAHIFGQK